MFSALLAAPAAHAQRRTEKSADGPPQPIAIAVKARRNEATPIPLRIFGTRNQTLTFLVRKPPRSGKLGAPEKVSAEAGVVRYTPPSDRTVTRETFTYAVRSAEGVSAPVEVTIEIVDTPAELVAPAELRFGPVLVGSETAQTFELVNRGGDIAEGEVQVNAPWRIDGPAQYQLETGARKFVRVLFAPATAGPFETEIRYTSHPDRATTLLGEGLAPLAVRPESVHLRFEAITGARSGAFEVINQTGLEQTVLVHASGRLKLERQFTLAAGARAALSIQIAPADSESLSETIRLEAQEYEARLPVRADPKPPALRIFPETLTLQAPGEGGEWRAELLVENIGGSTFDADLQVTAPFALSVSRVTLPAGAKEMLAVTASAGASRRLDGELTVRSPAGRRVVPLRAGGSGPLLASARVEQGRPREVARPEESRDVERERTTLSPEHSMNLSALAATRLVACTGTSATLEWNGTPESAGFRGEVRDLSLVNHQLVIRWRPHGAFKVEAGEGKMRGVFNGLKPGLFHAVRVMPKTGDAGAEPVAAACFETPFARKRAPLFTVQRVLLVIGATLLGVVLWQRQRSRPRGL